MNTKYFPQFIRTNYPEIGTERNVDLIEVGNEFKIYLEDKFKEDLDKLKDIWDIEPRTVIMNQVKGGLFYVNGYHPALLLHFSDFVVKMKEEIEQENKSSN